MDFHSNKYLPEHDRDSSNDDEIINDDIDSIVPYIKWEMYIKWEISTKQLLYLSP